MKYPTFEAQVDGWTEWIAPQGQFKAACCDCGVVHVMEFDVEDGQVIFRMRRDNRATGQVRRHQKVT